MDNEGGNIAKMKKDRVNLSLFPHYFPISSFSLHFLASRMQGCSKLCNPAAYCIDANIPISRLETNLISTLSELLRR